MNHCALCQMAFETYFDYHEHATNAHAMRTVRPNVRPGHPDYVPMDRGQKRAITARGELRLGSHHFLGHPL